MPAPVLTPEEVLEDARRAYEWRWERAYRAEEALRAAEDALAAARARAEEANADLDYERRIYNEAREAVGEDPLPEY